MNSRSYPPPMEKCAAPSCTNAYKYRDSQSKLPLCSLECYRAMKAVRSYYVSVSGYMDELLWAALWLHRATGREEYLAYAVDNADDFGGISWAITEFSWDVKYAGIQILAAECYPKKEVDVQYLHDRAAINSSIGLSSTLCWSWQQQLAPENLVLGQRLDLIVLQHLLPNTTLGLAPTSHISLLL